LIVGGGTAGCLVAGRLSEKYNVLLLESGGDPPPTTYNVFLNDYFSFHPSINLKYTSIAQANLTEVVREMHVGKMLGGSGSHNGNLYNRGSPQGCKIDTGRQ
jgi:choline dehydrogenase-like flavoprotein